MKLITYIVFYDFGFAPNPYFNYCTLATCKPKVRKHADVGDWVMGVASKRFFPNDRKLVFGMEVTEKLSFTDYWNDERFQIKKPVMNSSLKRSFGDNVYFYDENIKEWHQADSRHSRENGEVNELHLKRDTSADYVLISDNFYYFGNEAIIIPDTFRDYFSQTRGQKYIIGHITQEILLWLTSTFPKGISGFPIEIGKHKFNRLEK